MTADDPRPPGALASDAPAMPDASAARYATLFAAEAREQLAAVTAGVLALEAASVDAVPAADAVRDAVDAVFRAVHTVKGMSATMGYAAVERVAHAVESLLARVRAGDTALSAELVEALLDGADALDAAVDAAVSGRAAPDVARVLARLAAAVEAEPEETADEPFAPTADAGESVRHGAGAAPPVVAVDTAPDTVIVTVRIASDTPLPGVRAFLALRNAERFGRVHDERPAREALTGGAFDGTFAFRVTGADGAPDPEALAAAIRSAGDVALVHVAAADAPAAVPTIDDRAAAPAAAPQTPAPAAPQLAAAVRVAVPTLDLLLDRVGELAHARSRLSAAASRIGDPVLAAAVADIARLTAELQTQALECRLVPIGEVFDRMPRLVREAARVTGRRVRLEIEGADVTVDRAVLDALAEPLAHLLRNAVDHGVEPPDVRRAAGKAEAGRIVLRAARGRDGVRVDVEDDGRGVDRAAVLRRARARGLVPEGADADATADDERLLALLAAPGLSTAAAVSAVSGRGVGVDAALARVRALGGALTLRTTPGAGSCFTLRVPLTVAVAPVLLARDGGVTWAVPLVHVRETRDVDDAFPAASDDDALPLAGALGLPADGAARPEALVLEAEGRRRTVRVSAILGQAELVVKPLPRLRGAHLLFGGAAILDDGSVSPIVDVPALLHRSPA